MFEENKKLVVQSAFDFFDTVSKFSFGMEIRDSGLRSSSLIADLDVFSNNSEITVEDQNEIDLFIGAYVLFKMAINEGIEINSSEFIEMTGNQSIDIKYVEKAKKLIGSSIYDVCNDISISFTYSEPAPF